MTKPENPNSIVIGNNTAHPLEVCRMGYGTMRLTGPEIWGEPADRKQAIAILKKCLDRGINYLDTADYYGPYVTNQLIVEALYPYPKDLLIGTKVGALRAEDKSWKPAARPEELRNAIDDNLQHLKLEQLALVHFRMTLQHNPVPFQESMEAMFELQKEGKILHVSLSNVSPEELNWSLQKGKIATVQNLYSYTRRKTFTGPMGETRGGEEVLPICEKHAIPLIPFFSLLTSLPTEEEKIEQMAQKYRATKAQINLAWLLYKSPWILPIPGTSSLAHFEENLASMDIKLDAEDVRKLG